MNAEQIIARLKYLLQEHFSIDIANVDGNTRMRDMGIDSMHVVDLMLEIESEMGFQFDSLNLQPNPSLAELSQAIEKNIKRE
ncbi:MAG: acyl carrier protein [Polyangiaceae bacterium]|nr:acyl carrier protein [Polyangiaceae bacterium]